MFDTGLTHVWHKFEIFTQHFKPFTTVQIARYNMLTIASILTKTELKIKHSPSIRKMWGKASLAVTAKDVMLVRLRNY